MDLSHIFYDAQSDRIHTSRVCLEGIIAHTHAFVDTQNHTAHVNYNMTTNT